MTKETVFKDSTIQEVDEAMLQSREAFDSFKKLDLKSRAGFLHAIAAELKAMSPALLSVAQRETHLDSARLHIELKRTLFQLTSYADACAEGTWLDVCIDTADPQGNPPKPDLRKMLVPLGPIVVFGASNFPFAYSTAGGDTACALAAGCTVVIKAHPAHAQTSQAVAEAVHRAAKKCGLPESVFLHLHGAGLEVGKALVQHPHTAAVGFTGSFEGGIALADLANSRKVPIPVFAEMGSVNPVFLLPDKLSKETDLLAAMLGKSITQSVGQFCTNPGVLVGIKSDALESFKQRLGEEILQTKPAKMLHRGIGQNFHLKRKAAESEGAAFIATPDVTVADDESLPTLALIAAQTFIENKRLHKEVFGPFSLLVECNSTDEMLQVAHSLEGQLTCTVIATVEEAMEQKMLFEILKEKCGRFVLNGVPTGVEVALSMHHGGPFPATTDSRFTAVGADGIRRFARPVCFQNWSNELLPDELKNENPLGLWRTVNNVLTKAGAVSN